MIGSGPDSRRGSIAILPVAVAASIHTRTDKGFSAGCSRGRWLEGQRITASGGQCAGSQCGTQCRGLFWSQLHLGSELHGHRGAHANICCEGTIFRIPKVRAVCAASDGGARNKVCVHTSNDGDDGAGGATYPLMMLLEVTAVFRSL